MKSRSNVVFALGEGVRNAAASRLVGLVLGVISTLVFGGIAYADAMQVAQIASAEARWEAAGGRVLSVTNESGVSAFNCERLNQSRSIKAAVGLVRQMQRAGLANAPDANLTVVGFTAGLTGFLPERPDLAGALVSTRTAEQFGLVSQSWTNLSFKVAHDTETAATNIHLSDRPALAGIRPLAVADLDILGEEYSSGVALPIPANGLVDACLVWADPGATQTLLETLPAVLPGESDKPTVVATRLISGEFSHDYNAEYLMRAWRWVPLLAGSALGVIWVLLRWIRRSEDGLYQSLGIQRPTRVLLRLTEWTIYSGSGAVFALLLALIAARIAAPESSVTSIHVIRSILLGLSSSTAAAVLIALLPARNPLNALKDR